MLTCDDPIRFEPDHDERPRGYCIACACWVTTRRVDEGIGSYEYWGCKGTHHEWRDACPECDGDVLDEEPFSGD